MIVFCGIETEDELLTHLDEVDAEDEIGRCDWLHSHELLAQFRRQRWHRPDTNCCESKQS